MAPTKTFPGTPTELADMLSDPVQAAKKMGGTAAEWRKFANEYSARIGNSDPGLATQVKEQVQRELANMLRGSGGPMNRLDLSTGSLAPRNALYNKKAVGAKLDPVFNGSGDLWGDFFGGIWHNNRAEAATDLRNQIVGIQNAFGSSVPSDGGFLVPEVLRSEILTLALEQSIVRPRAAVMPMGSLRLPIPTVDDTSHASTVFGGLSGAWTEEGATLAESTAKFSRVVLEARKLTVYADVPNELIEDSAGALGNFLQRAFPATLAFEEDAAFIDGTGVGEPLGALRGSGLITVTKETGQVADTIVWENIVKMFARMLPSSLNKAVWLVSPDTFPELMTMGLSVGTGGSAVWQAADGIDGPPGTLLGRPVFVSEKAPKLGDAGDVSFIDFGHYLIGDRQSMTFKSSEHHKFSTDQTSFRCIERVDGRPWLQTALTPRNGGPTLSPYVSLGARA